MGYEEQHVYYNRKTQEIYLMSSYDRLIQILGNYQDYEDSDYIGELDD